MREMSDEIMKGFSLNKNCFHKIILKPKQESIVGEG